MQVVSPADNWWSSQVAKGYPWEKNDHPTELRNDCYIKDSLFLPAQISHHAQMLTYGISTHLKNMSCTHCTANHILRTSY